MKQKVKVEHEIDTDGEFCGNCKYITDYPTCCAIFSHRRKLTLICGKFRRYDKCKEATK